MSYLIKLAKIKGLEVDMINDLKFRTLKERGEAV